MTVHVVDSVKLMFRCSTATECVPAAAIPAHVDITTATDNAIVIVSTVQNSTQYSFRFQIDARGWQWSYGQAHQTVE